MKKILISAFTAFLCFASVWAQSGRKAAPQPKSAPSTSVQDDEYSESKPTTGATYSRLKQDKRPEAKVQPKPDETKNENISDTDSIKVDTNLVSVPVSVYERSGVYISGLRRTDFKIFEEGKEQEIAYFGNAEVPFSVILLIDVSGSTDNKIKSIQAAAMSFIEQVRPGDRVMVAEFDSDVTTLCDFTSDRETLAKAIRKVGSGGGTALYRAVDFVLKKKIGNVKGRKAIVLFTDGVDTSYSDSGYERTLAMAEEGDAVIYSVYYNTYLEMRGINTGGVMSGIPDISRPPDVKGYRAEDYAKGKVYLNELARLTGGKVFQSDATSGGMSAAFVGIAEELGNQYTLGYYSSEGGNVGQRKQIRVRVNRPNVAVRARDYYIVGESPQQPAASK